jgi:hypothetical protein
MADPLPDLHWSASFRLADPSTPSTAALPGDKILLPPSALEALLAAAPSIPSSDGAHTFTAFDPSNPYSVAAAQHERSLYRQTSQHLPNPLMFRLANQRNGNVVYAGIREFSANEGEVGISGYLRDALGIKEEEATIHKEKEGLQNGMDDLTNEADAMALDETDDTALRITVKAHQLPKGTYVRLRPLEAGYNPGDWKALLERQLRSNYTTLTRGAILSVRGAAGGQDFRLLVDTFRPGGEGICVVDTDLEVDIEALNEEQARETVRQIAARAQRAPGTEAGSSVGGMVDVWKEVEGQVLMGEYVDYELPTWDRARALEVELVVEEGGDEVDLFITPRSTRQRALPRESEHVFGDFSSPRDGVKRLPYNLRMLRWRARTACSSRSTASRFQMQTSPMRGRDAIGFALATSTSKTVRQHRMRPTQRNSTPARSNAATACSGFHHGRCSSTRTSARATTSSAPNASKSSRNHHRNGQRTGTVPTTRNRTA